MMVESQWTKPENRKSFIPAIPRALEKKHVRKSSDLATPSTVSDSKEGSHGVVADEGSAGGDDWASMVGNEQTEVHKQKSTSFSPVTQASSEPLPVVNGDLVVPEEKEEPVPEPEPVKPATQSRPNNRVFTVDGGVSAYYPDPKVPPRRVDPGIVFGGSVVSNESSPVLPPSASSTNHTHQTPLSDATSTHSQPSYQGYGHSNHSSVTIPPSKMMSTPGHFFGDPAGYPALARYEPPARFDPRYMPSASGLSLGDEIMANARSRSAEAMQSYLRAQFNNKDAADIELSLSVNGREATLHLHRVLVARSPKIRALLATENVRVAGGKMYLDFDPNNCFIDISDIIQALRTCYGCNICAHSYVSVFRVPPVADDRGFITMTACLGYLAAGQILQLPEVASVGVESACNTLVLADLERFILFALHGAVDALDGPHEAVISNAILRATHAPYSGDLVGNAINFLIGRLRSVFAVDSNAHSSEGLGGIPNFKDTADIGQMCVSTNPRLSFIQFGEMSQSDPENAILTTVLSSLPFEILRHVLAQLMRPDVTQAIVEERERRRHEYVKRFNMPGENYTGDLTKQTRLSWEEGIDNTGVGIFRHWVGLIEQ